MLWIKNSNRDVLNIRPCPSIENAIGFFRIRHLVHTLLYSAVDFVCWSFGCYGTLVEDFRPQLAAEFCLLQQQLKPPNPGLAPRKERRTKWQRNITLPLLLYTITSTQFYVHFQFWKILCVLLNQMSIRMKSWIWKVRPVYYFEIYFVFFWCKYRCCCHPSLLFFSRNVFQLAGALYGTFPWRKCSVKALGELSQKRRFVFVTLLIWVNVPMF